MGSWRLARSRALMLLALVTPVPLWAHGDLLIQIQALDLQIAQAASPDADLYLRRGDLHRRHASWDEAAADFGRARALDPDNSEIDWLEGRLRVEQGRFTLGRDLLSRFIDARGPHAGAYRYRAMAFWGLGEPAGSAADYAAAIRVSASPSPSLYRSWAIAEAASGNASAGRAAVDDGLERFPLEVSLLGFGVDLALSRGDAVAAGTYLARLPEPIARLPQWRLRQWLAACVSGEVPATAELPPAPDGGGGAQADVILAGLGRLKASSTPEQCRQAAQAMERAHVP